MCFESWKYTVWDDSGLFDQECGNVSIGSTMLLRDELVFESLPVGKVSWTGDETMLKASFISYRCVN